MSFNAETGEKESAQELWDGSSWVKMRRNRGMTMDRSNTFIGAPIPEEITLKDEIIVIVDPFSTGAHLAAEVCKQGYRCARVFSVWDSPVAALVQKGLKIDFCATIQFNDRLPEHEIAVIEVSLLFCVALAFPSPFQSYTNFFFRPSFQKNLVHRPSTLSRSFRSPSAR